MNNWIISKSSLGFLTEPSSEESKTGRTTRLGYQLHSVLKLTLYLYHHADSNGHIFIKSKDFYYNNTELGDRRTIKANIAYLESLGKISVEKDNKCRLLHITLNDYLESVAVGGSGYIEFSKKNFNEFMSLEYTPLKTLLAIYLHYDYSMAMNIIKTGITDSLDVKISTKWLFSMSPAYLSINSIRNVLASITSLDSFKKDRNIDYDAKGNFVITLLSSTKFTTFENGLTIRNILGCAFKDKSENDAAKCVDILKSTIKAYNLKNWDQVNYSKKRIEILSKILSEYINRLSLGNERKSRAEAMNKISNWFSTWYPETVSQAV